MDVLLLLFLVVVILLIVLVAVLLLLLVVVLKKIQKIALDGKVTYPRDGQAQGSLRTPLFDAK